MNTFKLSVVALVGVLTLPQVVLAESKAEKEYMKARDAVGKAIGKNSSIHSDSSLSPEKKATSKARYKICAKVGKKDEKLKTLFEELKELKEAYNKDRENKKKKEKFFEKREELEVYIVVNVKDLKDFAELYTTWVESRQKLEAKKTELMADIDKKRVPKLKKAYKELQALR